MRYHLQKKWSACHNRELWVWALYVKDTKWDDCEDAAVIYAIDRDGPFKLTVWDWVKREHSEYEGFKRLNDAKTMGKLLANMMFVSFPNEKKQNF